MELRPEPRASSSWLCSLGSPETPSPQGREQPGAGDLLEPAERVVCAHYSEGNDNTSAGPVLQVSTAAQSAPLSVWTGDSTTTDNRATNSKQQWHAGAWRAGSLQSALHDPF